MSRTVLRGIDRVFPFVLALGILAIWIVAAARALPTRLGDRGIFVSVGEHLLRGETLYVTTYDNKEPLFFYFVALQRAFGAWGEILAEVVLIFICSASVYFLARRTSSNRSSLIVGFAIIPIIVTGTFYFPGGSTLPATAAILAMLAALSAGHAAIAGGLLALVFLLKIPAIPVALATAFVLLVFRWQPREWPSFVTGAILVGATLVGIMAWRGELWPFVETIRGNIGYAQGDLTDNSGFIRGIIVHIGRVWGRDFYTEITAICLALALGVLALPSKEALNENVRSIALACAAALGAAVLSLGLTGMWPHHNQLLYISAAFAVVPLSRFLDFAFDRSVFSAFALSLCMAYFLGGAFPLRAHFAAVAEFRQNYAELKALPPETARLLAVAQSGTYARIGQYDDRGHAIGLDNWRLLCSRFHQADFEPKASLQRTFDCASKAPVLLIGNDFMAAEGQPVRPQWREFVDRVESMLASEYSCDAPSGMRVCVRRN